MTVAPHCETVGVLTPHERKMCSRENLTVEAVKECLIVKGNFSLPALTALL